jgi:uncharacterized protein YbjT (DUF2867 family)
MSRVVVMGATGHIGSYLVPRLVRRARGDRDEPRRAGGRLPLAAGRIFLQ